MTRLIGNRWYGLLLGVGFLSVWPAGGRAEDPLTDTSDPRIRLARMHRDQLVARERTLAGYAVPAVAGSDMTRLKELTAKMRPESHGDRADVLDELRKVIAHKKAQGHELLKRRGEADRAMEEYVKALQQAPAAFSATAQAIDAKVPAQKLDLYKKKQSELAQRVRDLAAHIGKQLQDVDNFRLQFNEAWDHVEGQIYLLESLDEVCALVPNPRHAAFSERLRADVDQFLKDAQEAEKAFKTFSDALLEKAVTDGADAYFRTRQATAAVASKAASQPMELPVESPRDSFAGIRIGTNGGLHIGQQLPVLRNGQVVSNAVVKAIHADSTIIWRPDGYPFFVGDRVRVATRSLMDRSVAQR